MSSLYSCDSVLSINWKKKKQSFKYSESGQKATRSHCWTVIVIGTAHTHTTALGLGRGLQAAEKVLSVRTYLD